MPRMVGGARPKRRLHPHAPVLPPTISRPAAACTTSQLQPLIVARCCRPTPAAPTHGAARGKHPSAAPAPAAPASIQHASAARRACTNSHAAVPPGLQPSHLQPPLAASLLQAAAYSAAAAHAWTVGGVTLSVPSLLREGQSRRGWQGTPNCRAAAAAASAACRREAAGCRPAGRRSQGGGAASAGASRLLGPLPPALALEAPAGGMGERGSARGQSSTKPWLHDGGRARPGSPWRAAHRMRFFLHCGRGTGWGVGGAGEGRPVRGRPASSPRPHRRVLHAWMGAFRLPEAAVRLQPPTSRPHHSHGAPRAPRGLLLHPKGSPWRASSLLCGDRNERGPRRAGRPGFMATMGRAWKCCGSGSPIPPSAPAIAIACTTCILVSGPRPPRAHTPALATARPSLRSLRALLRRWATAAGAQTSSGTRTAQSRPPGSSAPVGGGGGGGERTQPQFAGGS